MHRGHTLGGVLGSAVERSVLASTWSPRRPSKPLACKGTLVSPLCYGPYEAWTGRAGHSEPFEGWSLVCSGFGAWVQGVGNSPFSNPKAPSSTRHSDAIDFLHYCQANAKQTTQ